MGVCLLCIALRFWSFAGWLGYLGFGVVLWFFAGCLYCGFVAWLCWLGQLLLFSSLYFALGSQCVSFLLCEAV